MTFDQIKSEISARLREVRTAAAEFSDAEMYPDLQKLITKAISRVALCDNAADLDSLNDLRLGEADIQHSDTTYPVEELVAIHILYHGSLTLVYNDRIRTSDG